MPPSRRSSTASASPAGPASDTSAEDSVQPSKAAVPDPQQHPSAQAATPVEQTLTVRLPFLTVSVARPAGPPATTTSRAAPRSKPTVKLPVPGSGSVRRLLFYTGMAALGVAGVVEWPVAAAIAAGTYVASKARSTPTQPPSPGPGEATASG